MKTVKIAIPTEPQDLTKLSLDLAAGGDDIFFSDAQAPLFTESPANDCCNSFDPPVIVNDKNSTKTSDSEEEVIDQLIARRAKEASRRRVYRRLQKNERESLRRQVAALSEELAQLQRVKSTEKVSASPTPAYLFWKSLALRRKEKRLQAEAQQQELIAAVGAQTKYISTLSGSLGNRQDQDTTSAEESQWTFCERTKLEEIEALY